eukprot:3864016-Alexandrium_andersonii.AAC.1
MAQLKATSSNFKHISAASRASPPRGPRTCNIASGVRSLNCAGPGTTSTLVPEAPERCTQHGRSRWLRI